MQSGYLGLNGTEETTRKEDREEGYNNTGHNKRAEDHNLYHCQHTACTCTPSTSSPPLVMVPLLDTRGTPCHTLLLLLMSSRNRSLRVAVRVTLRCTLRLPTIASVYTSTWVSSTCRSIRRVTWALGLELLALGRWRDRQAARERHLLTTVWRGSGVRGRRRRRRWLLGSTSR